MSYITEVRYSMTQRRISLASWGLGGYPQRRLHKDEFYPVDQVANGEQVDVL